MGALISRARNVARIAATAVLALASGCGDSGIDPKGIEAVQLASTRSPAGYSSFIAPEPLGLTDDEQGLLVAFSPRDISRILSRVDVRTGAATDFLTVSSCSRYAAVAGGRILFVAQAAIRGTSNSIGCVDAPVQFTLLGPGPGDSRILGPAPHIILARGSFYVPPWVVSPNGQVVIVTDTVANHLLLVDTRLGQLTSVQLDSFVASPNWYRAGMFDDASAILYAERFGKGCMLVRTTAGATPRKLPCGASAHGFPWRTGFRYIESSNLFVDNVFTERDTTGAAVRTFSLPYGQGTPTAPAWSFRDTPGGIVVYNGTNYYLITESSVIAIPGLVTKDPSSAKYLPISIGGPPLVTRDGKTFFFTSDTSLYKWTR